MAVSRTGSWRRISIITENGFENVPESLIGSRRLLKSKREMMSQRATTQSPGLGGGLCFLFRCHRQAVLLVDLNASQHTPYHHLIPEQYLDH